MSIARVIEFLNEDAEIYLRDLAAEPDPSRALADAFFTVAVARMLKAEGPQDFADLLRSLLAKIEPMAATDLTVELLQSDPSLLRKIVH